MFMHTVDLNDHVLLVTPEPHRSHVAGGQFVPQAPSFQTKARSGKRLKNGNWSMADMKRALDAVDSGTAVKTAARIFCIPVISLCDHLYRKSVERRRGRLGVLTANEVDQGCLWGGPPARPIRVKRALTDRPW
jgi:hypothetical protein